MFGAVPRELQLLKNNDDVPGPDFYRLYGQFESSSGKKSLKPTAVFRTPGKKKLVQVDPYNPLEPKARVVPPGPGAYDPITAPRPEERPQLPEDFSGTYRHDRFGRPLFKRQERGSVPGPGSYDYELGERENLITFGRAERQELFRGRRDGSIVPGPGSYEGMAVDKKVSFLYNEDDKWV